MPRSLRARAALAPSICSHDACPCLNTAAATGAQRRRFLAMHESGCAVLRELFRVAATCPACSGIGTRRRSEWSCADERAGEAVALPQWRERPVPSRAGAGRLSNDGCGDQCGDVRYRPVAHASAHASRPGNAADIRSSRPAQQTGRTGRPAAAPLKASVSARPLPAARRSRPAPGGR